jgi:hypothetical protein
MVASNRGRLGVLALSLGIGVLAPGAVEAGPRGKTQALQPKVRSALPKPKKVPKAAPALSKTALKAKAAEYELPPPKDDGVVEVTVTNPWHANAQLVFVRPEGVNPGHGAAWWTPPPPPSKTGDTGPEHLMKVVKWMKEAGYAILWVAGEANAKRLVECSVAPVQGKATIAMHLDGKTAQSNLVTGPTSITFVVSLQRSGWAPLRLVGEAPWALHGCKIHPF